MSSGKEIRQEYKKGKFIVLDGPDGSGKGEQSVLLVKKLEQEGLKVEFFDFPQYEGTFAGELVGQMLAGELGPMENIHPKIASLPYAIDRWQATPKILRTIAEGGIAVANRFTLASLTHQSARLPRDKREDFVKFILRLENEILQIPTPDLYIHLDVPTEISQVLIAQKLKRKYLETGQKDELEKDLQHQVEAAKMYRELATRFSNIKRINCCNENGTLKPIEEIHPMVWKIVKEHLSTSIEGQLKGKERNA